MLFLSKRDRFAIAAMQSLIAKSPFRKGTVEENAPHIAATALGAYTYADVMLAASKRKKGNFAFIEE
jgi:hypothetical protein